MGIKTNIPEDLLLIWATVTLFTTWFDGRFSTIGIGFDFDIIFKIFAIMVLVVIGAQTRWDLRRDAREERYKQSEREESIRGVPQKEKEDEKGAE
jgi:hypothetical protein